MHYLAWGLALIWTVLTTGVMRFISGGLVIIGLLATPVAVPLLLSKPSSAPVDEALFKRLGYQVERTSSGLDGNPPSAILWRGGCRLEAKRIAGGYSKKDRWEIKNPPPSVRTPDLIPALELSMKMQSYPCADKMTPSYVTSQPGPRDPR
jgi:hypothetical protein